MRKSKVEEKTADLSLFIEKLQALETRVATIEEALANMAAKKSLSPCIQKTEEFNQEAPVYREETSMKMTSEEKIQSMRNAIKILPPNYVVNGRHSKQNVQALVGFMVTDEMMDEAYQTITHEAYK